MKIKNKEPWSRETLYILGIWTQGRMLIGKWARQKPHLLALMGLLVLIGILLLTSGLQGAEAASNEQFTAAGNWSTYLGGNSHSGFNSAETLITAATASKLKLKWSHTSTNGISDQAVRVGDVVYWGSWDGVVHAAHVSNNARIWTTFVGKTIDSVCDPPSVGVGSTPTVATVNGQSEVIVGGGDANIYALNATTGAIIWKTPLGSSPSSFLWASPTVFNGSVYMSSSSFGDCPLIQSQVFKLNAATGSIQNIFNVVPPNCTGGGVWGSPTVDEANGKVYFTTGNIGSCGSAEPYAFALVELNAADLSVVAAYQLPPNARPGDSDFGSTPTLFTNGSVPMVGVENKNGIFYAFNRTHINTGPVWSKQIANLGDCPQCGGGSVSPAAWDGTSLYIGGGNTTINGQVCKGGVRKYTPAGTRIWEHCMGSGPVLGSVTVAGPSGSEIVAASQGDTVIVMNASTGQSLARLSDHQSRSLLYDGPSISDGVLFVGNLDGRLYAYSINGL